MQEPSLRKAPSLTVHDFDFSLPPELIAQAPLPERSASRLLVLEGEALHDRLFRDLPGFLEEGDLLVFNDSRVSTRAFLGERKVAAR